MHSFDDVLNGIERRAAARPDPSQAFRDLPVQPSFDAPAASSRVNAEIAYRQWRPPPPGSSDSPSRTAGAEFSLALRDASHSPRKLRALRRAIARRFHPDLRARSGQFSNPIGMALWNARIDAALAACPVSSDEERPLR